jgi:hypothetical protein
MGWDCNEFFTTDEVISMLAERKHKLTTQIEEIMKETAVDCFLKKKYNDAFRAFYGKPPIECYTDVPIRKKQIDYTEIIIHNYKVAVPAGRYVYIVGETEYMGKPLKAIHVYRGDRIIDGIGVFDEDKVGTLIILGKEYASTQGELFDATKPDKKVKYVMEKVEGVDHLIHTALLKAPVAK